jgi:hypothetical protein
MKKTWSYLVNPFTRTTNSSYLKAYKISLYHYAALQAGKADPFILALLTLYEPLHLAFEAAYTHWKQQGGQQLSDTEHLNELLIDLSQKIKSWDVKIQNVYEQGTPAYLRLLPHGRSPFQTNGQAEKLVALKNLSEAIGSDANLTTVKTQVDNFIALIKPVFNSQKTSITNTFNMSDDVEANRIIICNAQFANLGTMINKYVDNTGIIEGYFDTGSLKSSSQTNFVSQLKPAEIHFVAKRTLTSDDVIEIYNTGTTAIEFYISDKKNAATSPEVVSVAADSNIKLEAKALGDIDKLHYLIVRNTDTVNDGSFELYLE